MFFHNMDNKRLANEIEWHREHVVNSWKPVKIPSEEIEKYRLNEKWKIIPKQFMFHHMGRLTGKQVLDFGSGQGINGVQIALLGADVTGLELSPDLVKLSNQLAEANDITHRCRFVEAEVTAYSIEPNSYDLVIIDNVLHHIPLEDFDKIFNKLNSALKPEGRLIIREPVALARIITLFKKMIPFESHASPDERELNWDDLDSIHNLIDVTQSKHFCFFERMVRRLEFPFLRDLGFLLDHVFLRLPLFRSLSGYLVIIGRAKTKEES